MVQNDRMAATTTLRKVRPEEQTTSSSSAEVVGTMNGTPKSFAAPGPLTTAHLQHVDTRSADGGDGDGVSEEDEETREDNDDADFQKDKTKSGGLERLSRPKRRGSIQVSYLQSEDVPPPPRSSPSSPFSQALVSLETRAKGPLSRYVITCCGTPPIHDEAPREWRHDTTSSNLSDDPTVLESIECVFSQNGTDEEWLRWLSTTSNMITLMDIGDENEEGEGEEAEEEKEEDETDKDVKADEGFVVHQHKSEVAETTEEAEEADAKRDPESKETPAADKMESNKSPRQRRLNAFRRLAAMFSCRMKQDRHELEDFKRHSFKVDHGTASRREATGQVEKPCVVTEESNEDDDDDDGDDEDDIVWRDDDDAVAPPSPLGCRQCSGRSLTCSDGAPVVPASQWPQWPLLLQPTPRSGTIVRGVRFSSSWDYLWEPSSTKSWYSALQESWGRSCEEEPVAHSCGKCVGLPINNGNEPDGEALVIDFSSPLFVGTLLLRIRHSQGSTPEPYDDTKGYFAGVNRRYQVVVRGMFRREGIPMTETLTGQFFNRHFGKTPGKFVTRGAIKVLNFFAPQLQARFGGPTPPYLSSPLGSTPQALLGVPRDHSDEDGRVWNVDGKLQYSAGPSIQERQEEPSDATSSVLAQLPPTYQPSSAATSIGRAKGRKKAFDKAFAQKSKIPTFDTQRVYTFEFLQHLIDFTDFTVELGPVLGRPHLADFLDGQPIKVQAAHSPGDRHRPPLVGELDWFWSFDVWHESLLEAAGHHAERAN